MNFPSFVNGTDFISWANASGSWRKIKKVNSMQKLVFYFELYIAKKDKEKTFTVWVSCYIYAYWLWLKPHSYNLFWNHSIKNIYKDVMPMHVSTPTQHWSGKSSWDSFFLLGEQWMWISRNETVMAAICTSSKHVFFFTLCQTKFAVMSYPRACFYMPAQLCHYE